MESVYVPGNPININYFVNECNDVPKLKIGEIFQLKDNSLSMCCMHCLQEFQYFTEFSLHIQEHYLRGEVAHLREIKEGCSTKACDERIPPNVNNQYKVDVKGGGFTQNPVNVEYFDPNFKMTNVWTDDQMLDTNQQHIFEPEINVESYEKPQKPQSLIEGTDYEKLNGIYRCFSCGHETTTWEHFKDHLQTHKEVQIFCPLCSKGFSAISYVRKHVNRTHKMKITADKIREAQPTFSASAEKPSLKPYEAKSCAAKSFVEGEDYEKINGRFKCLTCGREMLDHIKEHLLTHTNSKNVYCPICDKPFIAVSYVRKHVNRAHKMKITAEEIKTAQMSIFIPDERQDFARKRIETSFAPVVLCQSKMEKSEKYFECFHCHRKFTSLSSLRIHLKLHSGIKYGCPHCDKVFAMRSYVRDHIVAMHGVKRDEIPRDSIQQATGRILSTEVQAQPDPTTFECNMCKNQYNKRHKLSQHMKTHTAGPFLCVICGAVYKSIANLRYHMEKHQADPDKTHKCDECSKTYPSRRHMLSHYRTIHKKRTKSTTEQMDMQITANEHAVIPNTGGNL